MRAKEEDIKLQQEFKDHVMSRWARFEDARPINLRKEGKCIHMYLTIENYEKMQEIKKRMHCRTWNAFITFVLGDYEI